MYQESVSSYIYSLNGIDFMTVHYMSYQIHFIRLPPLGKGVRKDLSFFHERKFISKSQLCMILFQDTGELTESGELPRISRILVPYHSLIVVSLLCSVLFFLFKYFIPFIYLLKRAFISKKDVTMFYSFLKLNSIYSTLLIFS